MITVSNSARRDISRNFSISEEKIRVIYHGVASHFRPVKDEGDIRGVLEKYKIARPFILNVGGYNPIKNVIRLMKAFHKFKTKRKMEQKLVIAAAQGDGIRKIINSLSLQDEVILTGFIDNNELPELYNAADTLVFPSLHETFGMPVLEAMSCGCPVITSNVSSMPEIANSAAVLVNPYNVNEIEKAIYQVLSNEGLKEEMRKKGLERAKQFSWRKCAEEHLKVYKEVL
jgi:glycosyltransferase involved in cell wall biosynthesis